MWTRGKHTVSSVQVCLLLSALLLQILKTKALNMLTEAVQDGGQAIRDPVGGSVEFHFVPILKLISTLLIMGIFDDEDVKHILKMIEPNVFGGMAEVMVEEESGRMTDEEQNPFTSEDEDDVKEEEDSLDGGSELEDEGMGEEEEEQMELAEVSEENLQKMGEWEADAENLDGKKEGEDTEKARQAEEQRTGVKEGEDGPKEGLLQMKLPESVKLQVWLLCSPK